MFVHKIDNVYYVNDWVELKQQMLELRVVDKPNPIKTERKKENDRKDANSRILRIERLTKRGK